MRRIPEGALSAERTPVNPPAHVRLKPLRASYVPIADEVVSELADWSEPVQVKAKRRSDGMVDLLLKEVAK